MKKIIGILLSFVLLCCVVPAHGSCMDISYSAQQLQEMVFFELIGVMDEASLTANDEETIGFGYLLAEKITQVPAADVERCIFDETHCSGAKLDLMMLSSELKIALNKEKVRALAKDKQEDKALRSYALDYFSDLQPFEDALFYTIANDAEDPISAWALKLLYLNAPESGIALINEILTAYAGGALDERTSTALLYKGYDLQKSDNLQEAEGFISLCRSILDADPDDKNGDRRTVYFALSAVGSKQSLSFLMEREDVEDYILCVAISDAGSAIVYALYDEAKDRSTFAARMGKANYHLIGDVNDDNAVTAEDARYILRQAVHIAPVFSDKRTFSDLDFDNAITAQDARLALRTAVSLEKGVFNDLPRS